jgi:hypothetical protein
VAAWHSPATGERGAVYDAVAERHPSATVIIPPRVT